MNTNAYSHCKIALDFLERTYSYDTSRTGSSVTTGYADREPSTSTSNTNGFISWYGYNSPVSFASHTQNRINVQIYII